MRILLTICAIFKVILLAGAYFDNDPSVAVYASAALGWTIACLYSWRIV